MPPRAIRTQTDGLDEQYSIGTGIDCTNLPDMTRQEFKDESDMNKVLARYGVDAQQRPIEFGTIDFDLDLQQGLHVIRDVEVALGRMPKSIRDKYSDLNELARAFADGSLEAMLQAQRAADKAVADGAAAAAASSGTPTGA